MLNEKNGDLKHRSILTAVHQIILIQSCRDILALVKDKKCIKYTCISSGILVTSFVSAKLSYVFMCRTMRRASICLCCTQMEVNLYCRDYEISLLDQFCRILRTFSVQLIKDYLYYHQSFVTDKKKRNRPTISGISL